jgi:hypothetical protein
MVLPAAEPVRWLRSPALAGGVILGLGIPVLWTAWLVSALFDRGSVLGWVGLVGMLGGLSLIGVSMGRELRGLAALRRVDQLRADLASGEAERVAKAAQRWMEALPQHEAMLPALAAADSPEAVLALLRSDPPRRCGWDGCFSGGPPLFRVRRDHRGDACASAGRTDGRLAWRAAHSSGGGSAWDAAGDPGDAGLAAEDRYGSGDGRGYRNGRERGDTHHYCSSAIAPPGG